MSRRLRVYTPMEYIDLLLTLFTERTHRYPQRILVSAELARALEEQARQFLYVGARESPFTIEGATTPPRLYGVPVVRLRPAGALRTMNEHVEIQ